MKLPFLLTWTHLQDLAEDTLSLTGNSVTCVHSKYSWDRQNRFS
ncbi:hypothetical protein Hanom_Chr04g00293521 [Helianthus anomalus]